MTTDALRLAREVIAADAGDDPPSDDEVTIAKALLALHEENERLVACVNRLEHWARDEGKDDFHAGLVATIADRDRLAAENERLAREHIKLRQGECLGVCTGTDVPCQRDCYCSKACQTRDLDGSRGDLDRTLIPEALTADRDRLREALAEALDMAANPIRDNAPLAVFEARYARDTELRKLLEGK